MFAKKYGLSKIASFDLHTTEAQHYKHFLLPQNVAGRKADRETHIIQEKTTDAIGWTPCGLNDGTVPASISHTVEVFPSGFLPKSPGNIRQ